MLRFERQAMRATKNEFGYEASVHRAVLQSTTIYTIILFS